MKKRLVLALLLGASLACGFLALAQRAFALSDADYKKMMKDPTFAQADKALNAAWREAKQSLSSDAFEALKREQRTWVKSGRDSRARALMKSLSRVKAYAQATNERAEAIRQMAQNSLGDFPEDVPSGVADDVPDFPDDLPPDVPSAHSQSAPSPQKTALSSPEEAEAALLDRLQQADRISPNETLSYLETRTTVNGESCWKFSAQALMMNMLSETGQYAISPSGKVYELDGAKYVPLLVR